VCSSDLQLTFEPAVATEPYPKKLPNLYKGQQLLISGRYSVAQTVGVTLSGEAFGKHISYNYDMVLSDSAVQKNQFLTKIWAKENPEAKGKGAWFRRDPRIRAMIADEGYLGLGLEIDEAFIKDWF